MSTSKRKGITPERDPSETTPVLLGSSPSFLSAKTRAGLLAMLPKAVLIRGETGTGKEGFAQFIHLSSPRREQPLVIVDCTSLPESLAESILFGFERGAFTGAIEASPGKLEQAHLGTIFLDEVGELSPSLQTKLLRFLQEGQVQRLKGKGFIRVDVRVVAATHRDLEAMVKEGTFRSDLYHRLAQTQLYVPPLRERGGDVAIIATKYLETDLACRQLSARLGPGSDLVLAEYPWPGNVRELQNTLLEAAIQCGCESLDRADTTVDRCKQAGLKEEPVQRQAVLTPSILRRILKIQAPILPSPDERRAKVLATVTQRGRIANRDLKTLTGRSSMTCYRDLHQLVQSGQLVPRGDGQERCYELPSPPATKPMRPPTPDERRLLTLARSTDTITRREICEQLSMPERTASRLSNRAVTCGWLEPSGPKNRRRYRLTEGGRQVIESPGSGA